MASDHLRRNDLWEKEQFNEQGNLLKQSLVQRENVLPPHITAAHRKEWSVFHGKTAFAEKFQDFFGKRIVYLSELMWVVKSRCKLGAIEEEVLREVRMELSLSQQFTLKMTLKRLEALIEKFRPALDSLVNKMLTPILFGSHDESSPRAQSANRPRSAPPLRVSPKSPEASIILRSCSRMIKCLLDDPVQQLTFMAHLINRNSLIKAGTSARENNDAMKDLFNLTTFSSMEMSRRDLSQLEDPFSSTENLISAVVEKVRRKIFSYLCKCNGLSPNTKLLEMFLNSKAETKDVINIVFLKIDEMPRTDVQNDPPMGRYLDQCIVISALNDMEFRLKRLASKSTWIPRQIAVCEKTIAVIVDWVLSQPKDDSKPSSNSPLVWSIVDETKTLLKKFPWIQVTGVEDSANVLKDLSTAPEVARCVVKKLKGLIGSWSGLEQADVGIRSRIIVHHVARLVATDIARCRSDKSLGYDYEITQNIITSTQFPAKYTIKSELVDNLVTRLLLKLHPLNKRGTRELPKRDLLALCVRVSAMTHGVLSKIPDIEVNEEAALPTSGLYRATLNLQSAMIKKFGTSIQVKKLVAAKDPHILATFPSIVISEILRLHECPSDDGCYPEFVKKIEEEKVEDLFSTPLPDSMKMDMYHEFGLWIRSLSTFRRAYRLKPEPKMEDVLQKVTERGNHKSDAIWIPSGVLKDEDDGDMLNGETENPLAMDCSPSAVLRQFPRARIFGEVEEEQTVLTSSPGHSVSISSYGTAGINLPVRGIKDSSVGDARDLPDSDVIENCIVPLDVVLTVLRIALRFNLSAGNIEPSSLEESFVNHLCVLLQEELTKYQKNRVFLRNLDKVLSNPESMRDYGCQVKFSLYDELQTIPRLAKFEGPFLRYNLYDDMSENLELFKILTKHMVDHLKPFVSFSKDTKDGDCTPFCVNIPAVRVNSTSQTQRPKTSLEVLTEKEKEEDRAELYRPLTEQEKEQLMRDAEQRAPKKKRKWWEIFFCCCRRVKRSRTPKTSTSIF